MVAEMPSHSWAGLRAAAGASGSPLMKVISVVTEPIQIKHTQLRITAELGEIGWVQAVIVGTYNNASSQIMRGGGSRVSSVMRWNEGSFELPTRLKNTTIAFKFTIGGGATLFAFEV